MRVVVLGASLKPVRYSFLAVNDLLDNGHDVLAIGNKKGEIRTVSIEDKPVSWDNVHTVTLYLSPENQKGYQDYIKKLTPQRVIFNPGTENPQFEKELNDLGIETLEACTLVMLRTHQF